MSTVTPAPLQNVYYERKVGTPRSCYICRRETTTVLATLKTEDFLYTCEVHLTDSGFASPIPTAPPTASGPSAEEVKKVISDYEARQQKKKEKDKDGKDVKDDKAKETSTPASPIPTTPKSNETHRKFALHRQIFDMRREEIKRKEMGVRAKEVGKGLPAVPRGF